MLSPEERRLIAAVCALLVFGAVVKTCRGGASQTSIPKTELPGIEVNAKPPSPSARRR